MLCIAFFVLLLNSFAFSQNDDCANATTVPVDGTCTTFTTAGATQDITTGTCNSGTENIWVTFFTTSPSITITATGAGGSRPEIILGYFTTTNCNTADWVQAGCVDQTGNYATITLNYGSGTPCAGRQYYAFVTNNNNSNQGPIDICVTAPLAPPNDGIRNAGQLANCDTVLTGTNEGATNCGTGFGNCIIPPSTGCSFNDVDNNPATGDGEGADVGYSVENDIYYRFCPTTNASYSVTITPSNCTSASGVQFSAFQGSSSSLDTLLAGGTNGQDLTSATTFNFSITDFNRGCVYLEIDGFGGTVCDFTLSVGCTANCPPAAICILPVEWDYFRAKKGKKEIQLDWKTDSEVNSSHFEVLKYFPGQGYQAIGVVESQGAPNKRTSYSFTDDAPLSGSNRYRLQNNDLNGDFQLSQVVEVNWESEDGGFSFYPNPVKDELQISWNAGAPDFAQLSIFELNGRKIFSQELDVQNGLGRQMIDLSGLESGIFLYALNLDGRVHKGKLIKK